VNDCSTLLSVLLHPSASPFGANSPASLLYYMYYMCLVVFTGATVPSGGKIHIFVFPDSLDYLVQMYYDYLRIRGTCPDFRDPDVLNLPSANVNTSLLLTYEVLKYDKPSASSSDPFAIGEYHLKTHLPYSSKWSVFLHHCAPNSGGSVRVSGSISFINAYGHLDADLYPVLIYNSVVIIPLSILALFGYAALVARFQRRLQKIHWLLPVPLVFSMLSGLVKVALLSRENRTGEPSSKFSHFAVALQQALFYASARFVLFIAARGVGVVYYHTSAAKITMMVTYCFFYGVVVCLAQFFDSIKDPFQQVGPFVLSILSPAINSAYFLWVTQALSRSSSLAATMRNRAKSDLFERLTTIFQVCAALALVFASLDLLRMDMTGARLWPIYWTFGFFAQLVYIGGVMAGMWIYRPTRRNEWLEYSEDVQNNRGGGGGGDLGLMQRQEEEREQEEKRHNRIDVTAFETQLPGLHYASLLSPKHRNRKEEEEEEEEEEETTMLDLDGETIPPRRRRVRGARNRNANRGEDLNETAQRTLRLATLRDEEEEST